ncbi:MAG: hypothetical protein K2H01_07825 [Ruminococcus sp.]|nr:hypothetical protein [Ruminococcus sp.]
MNTFNNQMFNPQYINEEFYRQIQYQQYGFKQAKEVANAVKAIQDLCKAAKQLDKKHCQIAFDACWAEMAKELQW